MADPSTISGLVARYRADSITGLADGAAVTTWPDTSGNGFTANQATTVSQPTYVAASVGGQPGVRFAGGTRFLTSTASTVDAQQTIVAVLSHRGTTGASTFRGASGDGGLQHRFASGNQNLVRQAIQNIGSGTGSFATDPTVAVATASYDSTGGGFFFYRNGAPDGSGSSAQALTSGRTTVIGTNGSAQQERYVGDIVELLWWNRILSAAERSTVHSYAQDRYGITVADYANGTPSAAPQLIGSGTVTGSQAPYVAFLPQFSGSGSLSGAPAATNVAAAGLSGSGLLTGTSTPSTARTVALTGSGSLAPTSSPALTQSVSMTGTGSLSAATGTTVSATASLSGSGSLASSSVPMQAASVLLSGSGALGTNGQPTSSQTVTFSGAGSLVSAPVQSISQSVPLTGSGTMMAALAGTVMLPVALAGTGSLSSSATLSVLSTVTLSGSGLLAATGRSAGTGAAGLAGSGALAASVAGRVAVALSGSGSLSSGSGPSGLVRFGGSVIGRGYLGSTRLVAAYLAGKRFPFGS